MIFHDFLEVGVNSKFSLPEPLKPCAEKIPLVVPGGYLYKTQEHGVFSKVHLVSFSKEKH